MAEKLIRIFKKFHIDEVKEHVLVCGDLTANCSKCSEVGIKLGSSTCPSCGTEFKYITFRSLKGNIPKILKAFEEKPNLIFIDYDDFKHATSSLKIEDLFKN
ncbi:MAG: hypothetical protein P9M07_03875 [Candidatus Aceula meridiana]|nr:hypothetical protein [Candidatus Aceula meridiana]